VSRSYTGGVAQFEELRIRWPSGNAQNHQRKGSFKLSGPAWTSNCAIIHVWSLQTAFPLSMSD